MNKKQKAPTAQIIAFFAIILAITFTSCSDSGTGGSEDENGTTISSSSSGENETKMSSSSSGEGEEETSSSSYSESGTTISNDTDRKELDKLIGTWVASFSNEYYEALEFSANGYKNYENYYGEIFDFNKSFKFSTTVANGKVSGKATEVCSDGACMNVQNKNAVKNSITTHYQKNYLENLVEDCKEYPDDYDFSGASQCTNSALKSYKENDCKEEITEYGEDYYGITSAANCTWDKMMAARINTEYENFYKRMERYNYIIFSYFYDLSGDNLTTYQCSEPVNSKQEALDIIETGNYNDDNYCWKTEFVKKVP